jgi:hypothetical protein
MLDPPRSRSSQGEQPLPTLGESREPITAATTGGSQMSTFMAVKVSATTDETGIPLDTPGLPPVPRVYGLAASVFHYPASYADTGGSSLHQRGGASHPSFC